MAGNGFPDRTALASSHWLTTKQPKWPADDEWSRMT
jgi:hypothetical protein